MIINRSYLSILGLALLSTLLYSCKSSKNIPLAPIPDRTETEIFDAVSKHNLDYEWYCAEGKIKVKSPQENGSVKAYIRIQKDSAIWMVFKKLSVEAARVMVRPDSFFVLYRLEQLYEQGATAQLIEKMELESSFSALQDYLIGNTPALDSATTNIYQRDRLWHLESDFQNKLLRIQVDPVDLLVKGFELFTENNDTVSARYDNFKLVQDAQSEHTIMVPFKRNFTLEMMRFGNSTAMMDLKKIEINKPKTLKFSVPKHYKEITTLDKN